jgi:uncharacterized Zn-finger protein
MSISRACHVRCDRCGYSTIVESTDLSLPKVWLPIADYGDLCPDCATKFREFATKFFGCRVPEKWDSVIDHLTYTP